MSVTLRVILIISSFIAFYLCITKIKKSQLKIENSVTWMLGCIILILMSIFPNVVVWISEKLGFVAPVNFIFLVMIAFLLMQIFIDNIHITSLNEKIKESALKNNIKITCGNTVCTDCFDVYMTDVNKFLNRVPNGFNPISAEMEAFSLFYVAKMLNKNASCLMSVVDSKFIKEIATPEQREKNLDNMIKIALDSI